MVLQPPRLDGTEAFIRIYNNDGSEAGACGNGMRCVVRRMTVTELQVTWLTQEAYDRLKHELDELIANRPVIAAEINARREEGDLKENGGYHAAREEQGQQEARIRQLQELLRTAQVGEAPAETDTASARHGAHHPLRRRPTTPRQFLLGSREEGAHGDLEVFSPQLAAGCRHPRRQRRRDPASTGCPTAAA